MEGSFKEIQFVLGVVDQLPPLIKKVVLSLIGLVCVLFLIKHSLKALTDPELADAARTLGGVVRRGMISLLKGTFDPLKSPIKRPRTKFLFACLAVGHSYLSAVMFFFSFLFFLCLYFISKSDMSLMQNASALGVISVLLYFTVFCRTEADRDYLKAKQLWGQRETWRQRSNDSEDT